MTTERAVTRADIEAAHVRTRPPRELSETAPLLTVRKQVSIKLELLQRSGAFKPRGANNNLLQRQAPTVASGGRGEFFALSTTAPPKVAKIPNYGAVAQIAEAQRL